MSRARAIADELLEQERVQQQINASLAREALRHRTAQAIAVEKYGSNDIEIEPPDEEVEEADGGYWVKAYVWVDAEEVEGRLD